MTLWKLTIASIKMYFRNKQALFWALFFPLLIMIIFGLLNFEGTGTYQVGIVNQSTSLQAKQFVNQLSNNESIKDVFEITQDGEEAERVALEEGKRDVVVILPADFLVSPQTETQVTITVLVNQGKPQQAGVTLSILNEVFSQFERKLLQKPKLFVLQTENVNSHNLHYIDFLVPGIIAFSIMQLGIFSIAFTVVEYKEKGIMKRLFVAPLKPVDFTLSQVITRMVVMLMQVVILIAVAVLLFHVRIIGNYLILFVLTLMGGILFLGMGFAVAGIAKTQDAAAPIANIISFPQMFLANVFFPIESMPDWLQKIVVYLPLNYLADGIRSVATEAASWSDLKTDLIGLTIWIIISLFVAFRLFRWQKAANG